MKGWLNIIAVFCIALGLPAQNGGDVSPVSAGPAATEVFTMVEEQPEFPGGISEMYKFVGMNIKYPASAMESGAAGKCFLKFIVNSEGKVTNAEVLRGIPGCPECDAEALRVVKMMPDWKPGTQDGRPVNVYYNLPISFKIEKALNAATIMPLEKKLTPEQQAKHEEAMKYYNQGHKLEKEYQFDQALKKFDKSLSIENDNKYALFDKGKMHMILGEKDKACAVWNKMILDSIRKDEAEDFIKKYCQNENGAEEMAKYYNHIKAKDFFEKGMAEVRNGRYEAALHRFDSCLKYKPEHADGLYNKAVMHFKLDQKNQACTTWNKLIAINKNDKEVEELIKKHCN